jgi:DNA-binding phage protein
MGRTRPVKETILQRAKASPKFRAALIGEALELIAENDVQTAKALIRDYVLASIGFEALAKDVGKKPESIKRMLSVKGNPTISNMAALLSSLTQHEGIQLHVETTR